MYGRFMALMLLLACGLAYAQQQSGTFVMEDIAAVVGSEIILSSEVKGYAYRYAQEQGIDPNDSTAMKKLSMETLEDEISKNNSGFSHYDFQLIGQLIPFKIKNTSCGR